MLYRMYRLATTLGTKVRQQPTILLVNCLAVRSARNCTITHRDTKLHITTCCNRSYNENHVFLQFFFFSSSANIQQWASPFTAGVSWLSRPDQLTRFQTTSTWDGLQQTECSNREVYVERTNICRHLQFIRKTSSQPKKTAGKVHTVVASNHC